MNHRKQDASAKLPRIDQFDLAVSRKPSVLRVAVVASIVRHMVAICASAS